MPCWGREGGHGVGVGRRHGVAGFDRRIGYDGGLDGGLASISVELSSQLGERHVGSLEIILVNHILLEGVECVADALGVRIGLPLHPVGLEVLVLVPQLVFHSLVHQICIACG